MADVFPEAELTGEVLFEEMNRATGGCPERYRVRDLEGFVWGRLRGKRTRDVSLRPVYYKVRDAIHGVLPGPRRKIRPSAKLEDLFPRAGRWAAWGFVHERLGVEPPPLGMSPGVVWMFVILSLPLLCVMSALADWVDASGDGRRVLAGVLVMAVVGLLFLGLYAAGRSMRRGGWGTEIPSECEDVRGLVKKLSKPLGEVVAWEESMVQVRIRRMVVMVRGIGMYEVSPDACLIGDVGIVMKE